MPASTVVKVWACMQQTQVLGLEQVIFFLHKVHAGSSMAVWKINLNFLFRKKGVAIAILTLQLQLQLQLNSIERYIAIEIYFTNTRIFLIASLGSQLAQCKGKAVSGGAHCNPSYWGPSLSGYSGSV